MNKFNWQNEERVRNIVKNSISYSDCIRKTNLSLKSSGNHQTLKKYIKKYDINIDHFTHKPKNYSNKCRSFPDKVPLEEILVRDSTYGSTYNLKNRLIKNNILKYTCKICNISEWQDKKLSLHLDHINGINDDNRLENLRLLCPNCHSQTPTYCGKNKKAHPKTPKKYYCKCGNEKCKQAKQCSECYHKSQEKIDWPPIDKLIKMVEKSNYLAIGRKLGVSDNAIRKRIINHS